MNKSAILSMAGILSACLFFCNGCATPTEIDMRAEKVRGIARVAVLPFADAPGADAGRSGQVVANMIAGAAIRYTDWDIIEREKIGELIKEVDFQHVQMSDTSTALKVGKLLGVDSVIFGNVSQYQISSMPFPLFLLFDQNVYRVGFNMRIIDVESGQVSMTASVGKNSVVSLEDCARYSAYKVFSNLTYQITGTGRIAKSKRWTSIKIDKISEPVVSAKYRWTEPEKVRLLVIGISSYGDGAIPKVKYAVQDAVAFRDLAVGSGVPTNNITLLVGKDATRNVIMNEIYKMRRALTDSDEVGIVYFSGHGVPVIEGKSATDTALIPYDGIESNLEITGIRSSDIEKSLSNVRGHAVVILDACFSGKSDRGLMVANARGMVVMPAVQKKEISGSWITSTSGDGYANDFDKEQHGLFTYFFLQGLCENTADVNCDGVISIGEAFQWAKTKVTPIAEKNLQRTQVPEMHGDQALPLMSISGGAKK